MKPVRTLLLLCLALFVTACGGSQHYTKDNLSPDSQLYTAYNLWFENPAKIPSINYKRGGMIPVGTAVENIELGEHRNYKTISFTTKTPARRFRIYWNPNHHPGSSVEQFADTLFSDKTLAQLSQDLDEFEKGQIEQGSVSKGMSKAAVLLSYGPPPEKATFSQASSIWTYWLSRQGIEKVVFDDQGKVEQIEQPKTSGHRWGPFVFP